MNSFEHVSSTEQLIRMHQAGRAALEAFGFRDAGLTLIAHGHNYVFRVDASDSGRFVLRVQNETRLSDNAVQSQLLWLEALSKSSDLVVPEPVRLPDGALFSKVEPEGMGGWARFALLKWVEGQECPATIEGITPSLVASVGRALARLHRQSRLFEPPPGFEPSSMDALHLLGPNSVLGSEKARTHLQAGDYLGLQHAGDRIREMMSRLSKLPQYYGLIHGDPGFRNFVYHEGEARPIDFDECGWGYYAYDLAEPLRIMFTWKQYPVLRKALLEAYARELPLPVTTESQIDVLIAASFMGFLNWGFCAAGENDYQEFLRRVPATLRHITRLCSP